MGGIAVSRPQSNGITMRYRLSVTSLLSLAAMSCAGSHQEEVRDAHFESIEARSQAQQHQAEQRADQRNDAIDSTYDAREEHIKAENRPDAKAKEELVDLSKDRAEFRSKIQTRMEKISVRVNAAQQKLQVLGPHAPTALHTDLDTVTTQYNLLKQDVLGLDSTPDASWQAKRDDIERRADQLDDRVSKLSDEIGS